jgi:putative endonuclease
MRSRQARQRLGHRAEFSAAILLQLKAYRILARRFKTPLGEIDLIAKRGKTLAFVEVKGRSDRASAAASVHRKNQQRVVRAAQWYLSAHPELANCTVRFDVCLVAWYRWPHHIPNAFPAIS